MFKRKLDWKIKKLEQDVTVTITSVNKLYDSFSYYFLQELAKKDIEYVNKNASNVERINNVFSILRDAAEQALKFSVAENAVWPEKRKWYKLRR